MKNKKIVSFILAACLIIINTVPVMAYTPLQTESVISPRYVFIRNISPEINKSGTTVECDCTVQVHQQSNVTITLVLQKKLSSGIWNDYYTFETVSKNISSSGTAVAYGSRSSLGSGDYRVKAIVEVSNSSGNESKTAYSRSISIG